MKRINNIFFAAIITAIAAVGANAQADNAKAEKVVLDKIGAAKTIEYSIKPDETKEMAIIEVKIGGTLLTKSSQQKPPEAPVRDAAAGGAADPNGYLATQNVKPIVVPAKTDWILKKDGKDFGSGADGFSYGWLSGRVLLGKKDNDLAAVQPGTYVVLIKCVQQTACNDKLTLTLAENIAAPDPSNIEP